MWAAAAIVAQMVYQTAVTIAQWLAAKALAVAILAIVLPWVLQGVFIWAFEYIVAYGRTIVEYVMNYINLEVANAGIAIDINLTGPGGYIAVKTGLIEYASIIFTGWGLYWVIAVLAKSSRVLR